MVRSNFLRLHLLRGTGPLEVIISIIGCKKTFTVLHFGKMYIIFQIKFDILQFWITFDKVLFCETSILSFSEWKSLYLEILWFQAVAWKSFQENKCHLFSERMFFLVKYNLTLWNYLFVVFTSLMVYSVASGPNILKWFWNKPLHKIFEK